MRTLTSLLRPLHNCEEITIQLCKFIGVPVTKHTLIDKLKNHPDFPSLLSISDVCSDLGIYNTSIQIKNEEKLNDVPCPFVAQIKGKKTENKLFSLVYSLNNNNVIWYNPMKHKKENIGFNKFVALFSGFVQLYEKEENAGEKDYKLNHHREIQRLLIQNILILVVPLLICITSIIAIINKGISTILPILYIVLLFAGTIIGMMLVVYESDQYNPLLKHVCSGGGKTNCAAVLQSKASEIFGIHWSTIGLSYFMGILLVLLSGGIMDKTLLCVASWLNVIALPYTIFSIYYQAKIVKQWCPMCLSIQILLIGLFIISLLGGFLFTPIEINIGIVIPFLLSIFVMFSALYILRPFIEKAKQSKSYLHELQQIKYYPNLFKSLLIKQKHIDESINGIGIMLGNPEGKIHLMKVCNPYCGACARSHMYIDRLLDINSDIRLQIIFTPSSEEKDIRNKPEKIMLSLASTESENILRKALNDWYLSENKSYEVYAKQYPIAKEKLDEQIPLIRSMRNWCDKMEIAYTPTFFVNGYQLPKMYSFEDLKYLLSV